MLIRVKSTRTSIRINSPNNGTNEMRSSNTVHESVSSFTSKEGGNIENSVWDARQQLCADV